MKIHRIVTIEEGLLIDSSKVIHRFPNTIVVVTKPPRLTLTHHKECDYLYKGNLVAGAIFNRAMRENGPDTPDDNAPERM